MFCQGILVSTFTMAIFFYSTPTSAGWMLWVVRENTSFFLLALFPFSGCAVIARRSYPLVGKGDRERERERALSCSGMPVYIHFRFRFPPAELDGTRGEFGYPTRGKQEKQQKAINPWINEKKQLFVELKAAIELAGSSGWKLMWFSILILPPGLAFFTLEMGNLFATVKGCVEMIPADLVRLLYFYAIYAKQMDSICYLHRISV